MSKLNKTFIKILRRLVPASKYDVVKRHDLTAQQLTYLHARLASVDTRLDSVVKELRASVMSSRSVTALHQDEILSVVRLLEPRKAVGHEKIRLGSVSDGGYILLNDYSNVSAAISFGIDGDDNWDLAMARMGIPVFQFDHTIEKAPSTHPLLRFDRKKAVASAAVDAVTVAELVAAHSKLGAPDLILKMDIEGSEWDVLDSSSGESLSKFSQIVCEFHGLGRLYESPFRARALRVFQKLAQQFCVVHVHANNGGDICNLANIAVPSTLEITFANRARYSFVATDEIFPTPLDAANNSAVADIRLGSFKF